MNRTLFITGLLALSMPFAVAQAPTLKIGDKAPALTVAKWAKGTPVKTMEAGKVYVVEFWATWCGPCRASIPHISELAKKNPKVTFIGVNVWETQNPKDNSYFGQVEKFVAEMGDKMSYNVAIDGFEGAMAKNWMAAAGQRGIPAAFIVDHTGTIAWIGHPMEMDDVLPKVLDKTWNMAEAQKQQAEQSALQSTMEEVSQLMGSGDIKGSLSKLDELFKKYPRTEMDLASVKFAILMMDEEAKGYAYANTLLTGVLKDHPAGLNEIAWTIVDDSELKKPDFALALKMAKRAVELTKETDGMMMDTLALAYYRTGDKAKAISTQEKALAILKKEGADPEIIADLEARLKMFKG